MSLQSFQENDAPSVMAPKSRENLSENHKRANSSITSKSKEAAKIHNSSERTIENTLPLELQQLLLDVFQETFSPRFNVDLQPLVQEVKQHLYNRDFATAFSTEHFLEAYAMRWSPTRALAYADLVWTSPKIFAALTSRMKNVQNFNVKFVCLGGGAGAELLALTALMRRAGDSFQKHAEETLLRETLCLDFTVVDMADWSSVLKPLYSGLTKAPKVSKYTSLGSLAAKRAFIDPNILNMSFRKQDILSMNVSQIGPILQGCHLVTLMFTLNELYFTSMKATTNLLLSMTSLLDPGSLLLVVDSPGSYSTVNIGNASENTDGKVRKKYPMQWLLDHTLLVTAAAGNDRGENRDLQWEKVDECESKWFRLREDLKYPIHLEDMRYQYHFYRRL